MAQPPTAEMSDFEKQRLANIAERDALLKQLTLDAQSGAFTKALAPKANGTSKKRPAPKRVAVKNETPAPRRTSSRLAGITADSEVAKRKADQEYEAAQDHARAKRQRVSGDLALGDMMVNGNGTKGFLADMEGLTKGVARPYERTFGDEEVKSTGDKALKALREEMSGLALWESWEPNRIKVTPERIYSIAMHPTTSKPLIFAGDKLGNLGLFDASQTPSEIKQEDDEDEDEDEDPFITTLKPHTRTISAMRTHTCTPQTVYTASYDGSIRALDLEKSISTELYAAPDDDPLSGVDMAPTDPNLLYFTTLSGIFGRHDIRSGPTPTANDSLYQLSDKKIGGFSLHPLAPHYIATASLDRLMRVWDLRMIKAKMPQLVGEHTSRLSVSHAAFNSAGQVATSSYDDSVKIYGFKGMQDWKKGENLYGDKETEPDVVVRHNCQTGRWVTILRPQWQATPRDGVQRLAIGNMNRYVDVYNAKGEQLAQLGGEGITAVPAVAVFHPTENWVVGGTASGKLCLWM